MAQAEVRESVSGRGWVVATLALFAVFLAFGLSATRPQPALAATALSLPQGCTQASIGAEVVCTFGYADAEQTFTVPEGVSQVTLTATGASGGNDGTGTTVGLGGVATTTATVTAGETLYVEVGGAGGDSDQMDEDPAAGGFNGGGAGGGGGFVTHASPGGTGSVTAYAGGAGGGGASDVRTLPASDGLSPTDSRLVVGGGGGGACDGSAGGNAGAAGGQPSSGTQGGGGGASSSGGAGGGTGTVVVDASGSDGALGQGGTGGNVGAEIADEGGCGGGGGYYGGGGGSDDASGGGGSSYAPGGTTSIASSSGDGSVTIAYAPPGPATSIELTPATASVTLGGSQTYQAVSYDAAGASLADVTSGTTFSIGQGGSCTGATCTGESGGTWQVQGDYEALTGDAALTVEPAAQSITFTSGPATGVYGGTYAATATASSGLPVSYAISSGSAAVCTVDPTSGLLSFTGVGSCEIEAIQGGDASYQPATEAIQVVQVLGAPLTITASDGTQTYGGTPPTITASYQGLVNGDTASSLGTAPTCVSGTSSAPPVGTYTSSCSGAVDPDYSIGYVAGTVTVKPAPLTVTAASATQSYGSAPPSITPSYSGFVNGDTASSLSTAATCTSGTTQSSPVGTYASNCSGAADPNYTIVYEPGVVSVVAAPSSLSLTAFPSGPTLVGVPVIYLAQVSQGSVPGNLSGTVSFTADGVVLPGCGQLHLILGFALCVAVYRTGGSEQVVATYQGDTDFATSSGSLTQAVYQPPEITSADRVTATEGSSVSFQATASGYPSPSFEESGALPQGLSFSSSGLLTGTPAAGTAGVYRITITARSAAGVSQQLLTLVVQAPLPATPTPTPPTPTPHSTHPTGGGGGGSE